MPTVLDNLRSLQAAQGYASLGLHIQANRELEQMTPATRQWPEVLAVKLTIFNALRLWEMVEIVALQLAESAAGNPQWLTLAESARRDTRAAMQRERATYRAPRIPACT